jgi:hypothetical protein
VEAEKTSRGELGRALELLGGKNLIGTVFNKAKNQ